MKIQEFTVVKIFLFSIKIVHLVLKMKILKFFGIQPNYWIAIQNEGYYSYASDSDFGGMDTD